MAALNYADVFQRGLQGQKFTVGVKFSDLYDPSGTSTSAFKYGDGKTIKIPVLTVTGLVDHNRDSITTATRKYDNAWETKTLAHDRNFRTLVDPADIDETNMAASIGNITSVFVNEEYLELADVLGILYKEVQDEVSEEAMELINKRIEARKNKDFKLADELRDALLDIGVEVEDTRDGVKWKKI